MIAAATQIVEGRRFGEKRDGTTTVAQLSDHKGWTLQSGHGTEEGRRDSGHGDEASKTWWRMPMCVRLRQRESGLHDQSLEKVEKPML